MAESMLSLVAVLLALLVATIVARRPARTGRGIFLGTAVGAGSLWLLTNAIVFVSFVVPFGQIDFWLATKLHGLLQFVGFAVRD